MVLRVLQVNSVCGVGSTGRIATGIQRLLHAEGHECLIAYGRGVAPSGCDSYRVGGVASVALHGALSRLSDRQGFYSTAATKRLVERIREYEPDVIHLHNLHGYYLNVEFFFQYLSQSEIPVVWTLHDAWSFTGHCAYFDYVSCGRWRDGCFQCPQKRAYPKSILLDSSRSNWLRKKNAFSGLASCTIVTPSSWLSDLVSESFISSHNRDVIRNGIDTSMFRPTPSDFRKRHGLGDSCVLLGVASPWSDRKGLSDMLELAALVRRRQSEGRSSRGYRIVLVGLSPSQLRALPEDVVGLPRTGSASELAEIYTAADFFVNSTHEDNYPTVNLEAMACGTPVITYDTGGSGECLVDERFGRVVSSNTPEGILEVVESCGLSRFEVDHSVAGVVSAESQLVRYLTLYNDVIAGSSRPFNAGMAVR